jgi:hypothetical protein
MRRALLLLILTGAGPAGCASTDPISRMEQEMIERENAHPVEWEDLRRPWMRDEPSSLPVYRIHGGVGPASSSI